MNELKRVFITMTLLAVTVYVCATETDDPDLSYTHPVIQQLSARLGALEEQSKIQQHRIAELERRDLAKQKQNEIQQHRVNELEARDLAQQKTISELEAAIRNQQQQVDELNPTLTETNQSFRNLQDVELTTTNEETTEKEIEEHTEDSSTDVHRIRARRQQPEVDNVAFTVILVHSMNDLGLNQNVVFDKVETNIGNAYNPHHGVFIAPVAGTYVFHVSIMSIHDTETLCKIVVNGITKAQVYARDSDQGSQTLIVRLNQGDDVAIQNGRADHNVYGDWGLWTTFSGFLLRSDADINTIVG